MLNGKGLVLDEETGFLVSPPNKKGTTAQHKVDFLKFYRETGNVNKACEAAGTTYRTMNAHRHIDNVFGRAYEDTIVYLRNNVEHCLYQAAVKTKNVTAMFGFLRAYYGERYGDKRTVEHVETKTERIRKLLDGIKQEG